MPYLATFKALKKRAKEIDPSGSPEIDKTDVRKIAVLVDRYPRIVPEKYANCHVEAYVDDLREWVIEFDAARQRAPAAVEMQRAAA